MTINELRLYLNTVLNKDNSGNSLSPDELNILLKTQIYGFVKEQILTYRQYVATGTPHDDVIFTALLVDALQETASATLTAGSFTLPTDMLFLESLSGTYNAHTKKIEIVSAGEYYRRKHNLLSKPIAYFPLAYITDTTCTVIPNNMTSVVVSYIAKPAEPVFDYYNDANDNIVYLAAGGSRLLTTGETGSAGQTAGTTVTSSTVEMNIPVELHQKFADYLLSKVAIRSREQLLYEANQNELNKA